jgi:ribosome-binding factor A
MISITKVSVSPDLKSARIFVSCFKTEDGAQFIKKLNSQAGEYQRILSDNVRIRYTPKLKFILDDTIEYADRIEKLLKQ